MPSRRDFMAGSAAACGVTVLPFTAHAAAHSGDSFADGAVVVHPVSHASVVLQTPGGVLYVDPIGDPSAYGDLPPADMILITHEHGDHYNADTLNALKGADTGLVANPAVFAMLSGDLAQNAQEVGNGGSIDMGNMMLDAIPAYNTTPERLNFHPQGRDNGYVLTLDGFRVYVSGDTEDIPEMRALTGIDLAFVCMSLPFTMDAEAAASAVAEFRPTYVYPYHYRGRDDGTQDPQAFADMVGDASEVQFGNWYG